MAARLQASKQRRTKRVGSKGSTESRFFYSYTDTKNGMLTVCLKTENSDPRPRTEKDGQRCCLSVTSRVYPRLYHDSVASCRPRQLERVFYVVFDMQEERLEREMEETTNNRASTHNTLATVMKPRKRMRRDPRQSRWLFCICLFVTLMLYYPNAVCAEDEGTPAPVRIPGAFVALYYFRFHLSAHVIVSRLFCFVKTRFLLVQHLRHHQQKHQCP